MLGFGKSKYDGKPTCKYTGTVNGRKVTVYSSWTSGDPDRDRTKTR